MSEQFERDMRKAVGDLTTTTAVIRSDVADTRKRLFGNGNPGELAELEERLAAHAHKLEKHERKFRFARGALWMLTGLVAGAVALVTWAIQAIH